VIVVNFSIQATGIMVPWILGFSWDFHGMGTGWVWALWPIPTGCGDPMGIFEYRCEI